MLRNIMNKLDKIIMHPKLEKLEEEFFNKLGEAMIKEPLPAEVKGAKEEPAEK